MYKQIRTIYTWNWWWYMQLSSFGSKKLAPCKKNLLAPKLAPDFQNWHLKMAPGDFSGSYFLGARAAPVFISKVLLLQLNSTRWFSGFLANIIFSKSIPYLNRKCTLEVNMWHIVFNMLSCLLWHHVFIIDVYMVKRSYIFHGCRGCSGSQKSRSQKIRQVPFSGASFESQEPD